MNVKYMNELHDLFDEYGALVHPLTYKRLIKWIDDYIVRATKDKNRFKRQMKKTIQRVRDK